MREPGRFSRSRLTAWRLDSAGGAANSGLDPSSATILEIGGSQTLNYLYDGYLPGNPAYGWAETFRSDYAGAFEGTPKFTASLPGLGNAGFMSQRGVSYDHWFNPPGIYPDGEDPRVDMAAFDTTVVTEDWNHPRFVPFGDAGPETVPGQRAVQGTWAILQAAVAGGQTTIFLDQTRLPLLSAEPGATNTTTGESAMWRALAEYAVKISRQRYDLMRYKLDQAGHGAVKLWQIPRLELLLAVYDDYMASAVPAPVLAVVPTFLDFFNEDEFSPNIGNRHSYMVGMEWIYAEWCLRRAVLFADNSDTISLTTTFGGNPYVLDTDVADYLRAKAWQIATATDICGLGGTPRAVPDWQPQTAPLAAMFPDALVFDTLNSPSLDGIAVGGVVASFDGLTPSGSGPILRADHVEFDGTPMQGAVAAIVPQAGVFLVGLHPSTQAANDLHGIQIVGDGATTGARVQYRIDGGGGGALRVTIHNGVQSFFIEAMLDYLPTDGEKIALVWGLRENGLGRTCVSAVRVETAISGDRIRTRRDEPDFTAAAASTASLGAPAGGPLDTRMDFYGSVIWDRAPTDDELLRAFAALDAQYGGQILSDEVYGR